MFTTTGAVPLFVRVIDMPVKAVPVTGSVALMPPFAQVPFVNGVPWNMGAVEFTLPEMASPEVEPLIVIPPAIQPAEVVQMVFTGMVVPEGEQ